MYSLHIKVHFADDNRKSQEWNILCSPLSVSVSHHLQIQRTEISFSACHQGVNHYSENITVRWRGEGITVSSFSLCYAWRKDLRLCNFMILATIIIIIIIMFIYSGILTFYLPLSSVICANDHVRRKIKIHGHQATAIPSKWKLLLYCWFKGSFKPYVTLILTFFRSLTPFVMVYNDKEVLYLRRNDHDLGAYFETLMTLLQT